jgi:hypothetical protein
MIMIKRLILRKNFCKRPRFRWKTVKDICISLFGKWNIGIWRNRWNTKENQNTNRRTTYIGDLYRRYWLLFKHVRSIMCAYGFSIHDGQQIFLILVVWKQANYCGVGGGIRMAPGLTVSVDRDHHTPHHTPSYHLPSLNAWPAAGYHPDNQILLRGYPLLFLEYQFAFQFYFSTP